ncbi:MAG TPA: hypothetical protein VF174_06130 [Micromonosporaceae bacterium]
MTGPKGSTPRSSARETAAAESPVAEPAGQPSLSARLLDRPGYALELLAATAVDRLGPAAQSWFRELRDAYPNATPDALARLATRQSLRLATAGGAVGVAGGPLGRLVGLVTLMWSQAGLVLRMAAAYGHDPTHPDRAIDLLVLTGVHSSDETAREALAAALASAPASHPLHPAEVGFRLARPLAGQAGSWLPLRMAARLLPGVAVLGAAAVGSTSAQRLAARTAARFRGVTAR